MEKTESLYTSICASNVLDQLINDIIFHNKYESKNIINPITNNAIRISIIKYIILALKEDIILKEKKTTYKNNLLFSPIETLVNTISVVNPDGSITLGDHRFIDGDTVVAFIRNKIAHGDFVYSDDCEFVIFNIDGDTVPISLDALMEFTRELVNKKHEYKVASNLSRPTGIIIGQEKRKSYGYVSDKELNDLFDSYIEYIFDLSSENTIPKEAYDYFDTVHNKLAETNHKYRDSSKERIIKEVEKVTKDFTNSFNECSKELGWGVELTYKRNEFSQQDKEKILDTFKKNKGNSINYFDAVSDLPFYAMRYTNEQVNKLIVIRRCHELLEIINVMKENKNPDFKEAAFKVSDIIKDKIMVNQDSYAAVQLLRLLDFSYMFENFDVEYDKLPLESIKPSVYKVDDKQMRELDNIINSAKRKVEYIQRKIDEASSNIENISNLQLDEETKMKLIDKVYMNLDSLHESYLDYVIDYEDSVAKKELIINDRNNNKEYYRNKELLERMRDSVSHGNVYIVPTGSILNTIVRFEDRYDGDLVFALDISLVDLINILNECTNNLFKGEAKIRKK